VQPGVTARTQADQVRDLRNSRAAMMDGHRTLPCGRPGTELAGVTIPIQDLRPQPGEVAGVPAAPGIAAGAVTTDQLAFLGTEPAPQRLLRPADGRLLVKCGGKSKRSQGESLRTAEMRLYRG
jgi:hypothetical protein